MVNLEFQRVAGDLLQDGDAILIKRLLMFVAEFFSSLPLMAAKPLHFHLLERKLRTLSPRRFVWHAECLFEKWRAA
jgi:hypothetical protein